MRRYLALLIAVFFLTMMAVGGTPALAAEDGMTPPADEAEEGAEDEATEAGEDEAAEMAEEGREEEGMEEEGMEEDDESDSGEDLESASNDYLEYASQFLDDNKLGPVRFTVTLSTDFVYDSNIFLNDKNEPDTEGEVDDFILRLAGSAGAVMNVNEKYTKLFNRDRITLVRFDYIWNKYLDHNEVTNSNWNFTTDLFGFINDLLNIGAAGKSLYFKVNGYYSDLTDPLDLIIRAPFLAGFPEVKDVSRLRRTEAFGNAEVGWIGNGFDAALGYEFYMYDFHDDVFAQANHRRHTGYAEIGFQIPQLGDKRIYVRGRYSDYDFTEELLNNAKVTEAVLGLDGLLFSKKMRFDVNAGWCYWDPQMTGVIGDDGDYDGMIGWGQVVYKPWEQKSIYFQLEGGRKVDWSAISNFRVDDLVMFTYKDELMKDRLDLDVNLQWSHHRQSEGPVWDRYEAGAGLVYHLHRQVDVRLRYLFRMQDSDEDKEITNTAVINNEVIRIATNGNFTQHVVSLGVEVRF